MTVVLLCNNVDVSREIEWKILY